MAEKKTILLRLSPKMWEEISKWAEDEFRSVNGQIEYLISEALRKRNKSSAHKSEFDTEGTSE
ncbi:MAG TPA: Arc family DNA binding domain-containing protein [Ruminiclostridium sp.]|nr:Arc family DNA binding domain-containing protein [Ruminiclostridium sp.]